jgi:hypothetical protein
VGLAQETTGSESGKISPIISRPFNDAIVNRCFWKLQMKSMVDVGASSFNSWTLRRVTDEDKIDWAALCIRVFHDEPVCASYRGSKEEAEMWRHMGEYAVYTASKGFAVCAFHKETGAIGAFVLCKPLDHIDEPIVAGPMVTGFEPILQLINFTQSYIPMELRDRLDVVYHVALIGRAPECQERGLMRAALAYSLKLGRANGFVAAIAETSSAQSTWICVSTGATIVQRIPYAKSSCAHIANIPPWVDSNSDVVDLAKEGLVDASIRLVLWDFTKPQ